MKHRILLVWFFTLIIFLVINGFVLQKEQVQNTGQLVFLELAPADPRSLIQGDYMRLRYKLSDWISRYAYLKDEQDGMAVVQLDERQVAQFVRIYDSQEPLAENELLLPFHRVGANIYIGPESFFFQEGHASYYTDAVYGEIRVSKSGEILLIGLRDEALNPLGP